jgi:hypothetical protein
MTQVSDVAPGPFVSFRMGFALALGALPKFFVQGKLDMVLTCLIEATAITEKEKKWVEARRDAVTAITE